MHALAYVRHRVAGYVKYGCALKAKRLEKCAPVAAIAIAVVLSTHAIRAYGAAALAVAFYIGMGFERVFHVGPSCDDVEVLSDGTVRWKDAPENKISYRKVCVFVGDSLTTGSVSDDWVSRVQSRNPRVMCIREARNGDLSINAISRAPRIKELARKCKASNVPFATVVLIGANDLIAATSKHMLENYRVNKGWMRKDAPTLATLESALVSLLDALVPLGTGTLFLSPPGLGEALPVDGDGSFLAAFPRAYRAAVARCDAKASIVSVDLRAEMSALVGKDALKDAVPFSAKTFEVCTVVSVLRHWFLGDSWDKIGASRGLYYTHDLVHLTSVGGEVVAQCANAFLAKVF